MSRRRLAAASLLVPLAASLALSGCGRADASVGQSSTSASTTIDNKPATGTIEMWAMGTEGEALPKLTKEFEAANPGVKVDITAVPWSDYMTKIQTAVASGQTPDLTMVGTANMAAAVAADALAPVPSGLVNPSSFFASAEKGTQVKGTTYAVPWYVETRVLFYRSDLAQAAGVQPPTTWSQSYSFYKALQAQGATYGTTLYTGMTGSYMFVLPYLWQAGAQILSADGKSWTFDTPEAVKGLEYYQSLIKDGYASPNGPTNIGQVEPQIVSGKLGSITAGPWEKGLLVGAGGKAFYNDKIAAATLPAGPAGNTSWVGGSEIGVFKDAKNPDGAWKLVRWLSQPANQQKWYDLSGDLPAVSSAWSYAAIANDKIDAVLEEQMANTSAPPAVTTWPQVSAAMDTAIEQVAKGAATPAEALAQLQKKAASIGTGS